MKRSSLTVRAFAGLVGLAIALAVTASSSFGQGITTSGIDGTVSDARGNPVPGAVVTAVHVPSGTRAVATTTATGEFRMSGLRVGGPYTVTASSAGAQPTSHTGVFLNLGQTTEVDLRVATPVMRLETFRVVESRDTTFGTGKTGSGTSLDAEEIMDVPSIRRNVQDFVRLDPRVNLTPDQGDFDLSVQGQNFRYNSLLIDGVQANDPFGLNGNGFATLRSPIPPDALQAITVELDPTDVRRTGFTGALLNAVTKSGTNTFHGSTYYEYTSQNMRRSNPITGVKEPFQERTYGATLGGPILRDRLFFFLSYDDFKRSQPAPVNNFEPNADTLASIVAKAKSYNYDPGTLTAGGNISKQKTYLAKIDWNISDKHRLDVAYRRTDGSTPIFANFSGSTYTSLSNDWYQQPRVSDNYKADLFSQWTPDFRTEAAVSYSKYDGTPQVSSHFPLVVVRGVPGIRVDTGASITSGEVDFGTEQFRQLNAITTKTTNGSFTGEYSLGNHTFLLGADAERTAMTNAFVPRAFGSYTFTSVNDWLNGTNATLSQAQFATGSVDDAIARFSLEDIGVFAQDTWRPASNLTVNMGLRLDDPYVSTAPKPIPDTGTYSEALFRSNFGISSTTTNNGNYTLGPRLGFTRTFNTDRKTQLRGSIGLYQGKNPAVWLSNSYSNRGVVSNVVKSKQPFSSNINYLTGTGGIPTINVTDPDFRQPVAWKGNLALDHRLPFLGFDLTLEYDELVMTKAPYVTDLNLKPTGLTPDGRILYAAPTVATGTTSPARGYSNGNPYANPSYYTNPAFADVFYLTDANKGESHSFTLQFSRPMRDRWSAAFAWTRTHATDVSSMTSSIAQSNYYTRPIYNPNESNASLSPYAQQDRIIAMVSRQFEWVRRFPTTITVLYEGASGRPYSYVFRGDANGDGFTGNDLFYVPTGPDDPKVNWAKTSERDAFFAFVNQTDLRKYMGRVVPRNAESLGWNNTIDLRLTQTIPIYRSVKTELYVNVLNFANLFDKKWGRRYDAPFPYVYTVAGATYDSVNNRYNYVFNSSTLGTFTYLTDYSRWQVQVGVRASF